jgi:hypothetical protein
MPLTVVFKMLFDPSISQRVAIVGLTAMARHAHSPTAGNDAESSSVLALLNVSKLRQAGGICSGTHT